MGLSSLRRIIVLLAAVVLVAGVPAGTQVAVAKPVHAKAAAKKHGRACRGKAARRHARCRRKKAHRRHGAARRTPVTTATEAARRPRPRPTPRPAPSPRPTPSPAPAPVSAAGWGGFGARHWPGASWRPYAADSPFNQPVANTAVHPDSAAMVARVLQWGRPGNLVAGQADTPDDYGHPVYFSQPTDPLYRLHATQPWGRNPVEGMEIPVPAAARPAGGSDAHMTIVTPDGWEYDLWQVQSKPAGGGTLSFGWGGRLRVDGTGLGQGGTAAEFGSLAGMIRPEELEAGHIDHALFIVLKCTSNTLDFGYGEKPHAAGDNGSSYVYPALKGGSRCDSAADPDAPPMGARFALAMSDAQIAALAVPQWKKTILTALAHYGGYVGDTGGPGFAFMLQSSSTYTSFGSADPLVTFAQRNNLPQWDGRYVFDMASGVDWARYLRVLVPPST